MNIRRLMIAGAGVGILAFVPMQASSAAPTPTPAPTLTSAFTFMPKLPSSHKSPLIYPLKTYVGVIRACTGEDGWTTVTFRLDRESKPNVWAGFLEDKELALSSSGNGIEVHAASPTYTGSSSASGWSKVNTVSGGNGNVRFNTALLPTNIDNLRLTYNGVRSGEVPASELNCE